MTTKLPLLALVLVIAASAAAEEEKRADEMPALTARSIAVTPAYPRPGEAAAAVLTITNSSNAPAENVEVAFYANGAALASRTVTIGTFGTATVSVPWMEKSAGRTTLVAKVDPRRLLDESDRYDNTTALDVVTAEAPAVEADFAVTAVDVLAPAESPGSIRVVVGNEGTVSAGAPLVIRRNGAAVTVVDTGVIDAGKSATIDVPWSDPDRGKISAEVNPRWAALEPSSKNNLLAASAATEGVDLRVEQLAFHTLQYEEGRTRRIGVHFRIVNDGAQGVTAPFRTRIDPGAVDAGGKLVPAYVSTAAIPAGGTVYVSHIFESAPGEFATTVVADVDDAVNEADEKNNAASKEYHNPAPDPDRWVNIGPRRVINTGAWYGWSSATGRLSTMAINPAATGTMYVGAQLSGVWKTVDGGANWIAVGESATVRVAALALMPGSPSHVFLVTPHDGVFRSDDAGTSWAQISTMDLAAMVHAGSALLMNPAAPSQMVVSSELGVFRSTDGGVTWSQTLPEQPLPPEPPKVGACNALVHMAHNGALYASLYNKTDAEIAGVYESFDWGGHWHLKRGCPDAPLPTDDADTLIRLAVSGPELYVSYFQTGSFRLFRTTNLGCSIGGESDSNWKVSGWNPGSNINNLWSGLWADPTDPNILYMAGSYLFRSTDRGDNFSTSSGLTAGGSAHSDHHQIAIDPVNPSIIYSLTDGGIYRSTSHGSGGSWVSIGDGITNVEFYDGVAAPANANLMIGGTQDNGTLKGSPGNAVWSEIKNADGATVDIDPANSSIMYAMHQYANSVSRSTNGGGSFSVITNGLPPGNECQNLHFQVHPNQPATLLASCHRLWRSLNSGSMWSLLFISGTDDILRSAIDGPADLYYAGTAAGEIVVGPVGRSFHSIFQNPDKFALTDLEINRADPSVLYASFGGPASHRVFRLVRNIATGTYAPQDITSDLPFNLFVRTVAIDKNRPLTVYAGTDRGVFQGRSTDAGATWFWRPYNNGMPPADVQDLEVHPTTGIMRAFTFGRSAFEVTTSTGGGAAMASK